jgi:hypothetical protein
MRTRSICYTAHVTLVFLNNVPSQESHWRLHQACEAFGVEMYGLPILENGKVRRRPADGKGQGRFESRGRFTPCIRRYLRTREHLLLRVA